MAAGCILILPVCYWHMQPLCGNAKCLWWQRILWDVSFSLLQHQGITYVLFGVQLAFECMILFGCYVLLDQ